MCSTSPVLGVTTWRVMLCPIDPEDKDANNAFHVAAAYESIDAINIMLDHATPGDLAKQNRNGQIPADLIPDHLPSVAAGMRPLSKSVGFKRH